MHPLAITTTVGVLFAVDEEDIKNHVLDPIFMVVGFIGEALNILPNLGPDGLILSDCIPWGIWVVSKGINCDLCQRLRMLDILKQLIAQTSILLSALSEGADPSPIGMVFGKQESLPADRAKTCQARAGVAVVLDSLLKLSTAMAI